MKTYRDAQICGLALAGEVQEQQDILPHLKTPVSPVPQCKHNQERYVVSSCAYKGVLETCHSLRME